MTRARRVPVDDHARGAAGLADPDYASAFAVGVPESSRSAQDWARAAFEHSPRGIRWPVVLGWRGVLLLRLGPRTSPQHVLGWQIVSSTPDRLMIAARSPLLSAVKVVALDGGQLVATTVVRYENRWARPVWAVVALVHHRTEPLLLTLAARRQI